MDIEHFEWLMIFFSSLSVSSGGLYAPLKIPFISLPTAKSPKLSNIWDTVRGVLRLWVNRASFSTKVFISIPSMVTLLVHSPSESGTTTMCRPLLDRTVPSILRILAQVFIQASCFSNYFSALTTLILPALTLTDAKSLMKVFRLSWPSLITTLYVI